MSGVSEEPVARWRGLLRSYSDISSALDRTLQEKHDLGLSEFEVLDRLAEVDNTECRMLDLGADMYLSQSALSRTVARLERDGLVARAACMDDRRSIFVELTDAGRARHRAAKASHRAVLAEHLT
jgi:DNA-binding MarR family transcriptional regulator